MRNHIISTRKFRPISGLDFRMGVMRKTLHGLGILTLLTSGVFSSCGKSSPQPAAENVLVSMGDTVLTLQDVESRIPVGIDEADSVALFRKIVDDWIETMVLSDMAREKLPEIREIERKVSAYRNRLIVTEYLRRMRDSKPTTVSREDILSFYEEHRKEMVAETPLVKGIYLKVPEAIRGIDEIRRLMNDASGQSIDILEKNWMGEALQYEYFGNRWVDWNMIAEQIPYRFYDADAFLSSEKNFETTYGGSVYFLHISDVLPSGSELPFDFASSRISAILEQAHMSSYEDALVRALIKKAISDKKLVAVDYDPVVHMLKRHRKDKKEKD